MSNIVDFNKVKSEKMQQRLDELVEEHEYVEELAADFAISAIMDIVEALYELGYDVRSNPDSLRDMLVTVEAIRSIVHRIAGEKTAMHRINDRMFEDIEDTEASLDTFLNDFSE